MAKRRIIGIMAAKGAGKSTSAAVLASHGFKVISIASPIKDMLATLGLTDAHLYGKLKEKPSKLLMGKTPRHAMQKCGDFLRTEIHADILLAIALRKISACTDDIVIDDVRLPEEVEAIRAIGGEIWVARRPSVEPKQTTRMQRFLARLGIGKVPHRTELYWRDYVETADQLLLNTESKAEFEVAVSLRLVHQQKRKAA